MKNKGVPVLVCGVSGDRAIVRALRDVARCRFLAISKVFATFAPVIGGLAVATATAG